MLYGTSRQFLVHFGLDNLDDLPSIEDFGEFVEVLEAGQERFWGHGGIRIRRGGRNLATADAVARAGGDRHLRSLRAGAFLRTGPQCDSVPRWNDLNKLLARSGVTSRRGADRLIEQGRVNGQRLGRSRARHACRLGSDTVKVDGKRLRTST